MSRSVKKGPFVAFSLLKKIDEILPFNDTTQETCKLLNYTIRGWMNYYAGIVTSQSLSNVKEKTLSHIMSLTGDNRIVEFVEEIFSSYDCQ